MTGSEARGGDFCAFHVALPEPWEPFLVEVLRPFVAHERAHHRLERAFFVRMREPQPHLRIRLLGDSVALAERWRAHDAAQAPAVVSNDSATYEPETHRFGHGPDLARAEAFFDASSAAVLDAMASPRPWNGRRARAVAMALHLAVAEAAPAAGVSPTELFRGYARRWGQALEARVLASAEAAPAVPAVARLWRDPAETQATEPWLLPWRRDVARLVHEHAATAEPSDFEPWLHDQMHLTNNRLGIAWGDEPFLAALLARGLADVGGRTRPGEPR